MVNNVEKRDGSLRPFTRQCIITAITKAGDKVPSFPSGAVMGIAQSIANDIAKRQEDTLHVEAIQDLVEQGLMKRNAFLIAQEYIRYRHARNLKREQTTGIYNEVTDLFKGDSGDALENANKDANVIPTQRDMLAGIISRHYAVNHMLPEDVAKAHKVGDIHFHDTDYSPLFPSYNCMLVDLENMLSQGYTMGNAKLGSPKSISVAAAQTAQIIAQVSSHIYGGTSLNRLDEVLAPYVTISYEKHKQFYRDFCEETSNVCVAEDLEKYAMKRTKKEVYDAVQALEYEVNTLHTANGQTPFVTFGFGLGESWQSRLIQESILRVRIKGLGDDGNTPVFPKLVYAIKDGHNHKPQDPFYSVKRLALECSSKRMYPDILNYDKLVEVTGGFKTPMGCRSFLGEWRNESGEPIVDGRNNLGVVSLNLPRIAIEAKEGLGIGVSTHERFFNLLDGRLDLCRKALMFRVNRFKGVKAKVAPILYMHGACGVRLNEDDDVMQLFENGRASISLGYIGIHETVRCLEGDNPIADNGIQELGLDIVRHLRDACDKWKDETGFAFSLYSTPSESLCNRFCKLDVESYGEYEGVNDHGYYTNSFHLDVREKVDPFHKIDFESQYPAIANGGFINYAEFPVMLHNLDALERVWDYTYTRVPYFGTNTPCDECYECGFKGEFDCTSDGYNCPECSNTNPVTSSVTRRVCGYLGSPDNRPFNEGKQQEVQNRVKHC